MQVKRRKNGEQEAIDILKTIGIIIDDTYRDDNSKPGMPDLRYADDSARYVEVTHTKHDNSIFFEIRKFYKRKKGESIKEYNNRLYETEILCAEALERVRTLTYERDVAGMFSSDAVRLYNKDVKILKEHLGYDPTQRELLNMYSEDKCDSPTIIYTTDNIIREIEEDKGPKHQSGNTDLFIYVTGEEYDLMTELLASSNYDRTSQIFLERVYESPFHVIYVCEWNMRERVYNVDAPKLTRLYKNTDKGTISWECYN